MTWLLSLLGSISASPVGRLFGLIGLALAAIAAAFLRGRTAGRDDERRRQVDAALDAHQTRERIDEDIRRDGPGAARERLRDWPRD